VRRSHWAAPRAVQAIQDRWRVDDEWWRERPISRLYYAVLLDNELLLTLFHDLIADTWCELHG
jgi:hypothetical protein